MLEIQAKNSNKIMTRHVNKVGVHYEFFFFPFFTFFCTSFSSFFAPQQFFSKKPTNGLKLPSQNFPDLVFLLNWNYFSTAGSTKVGESDSIMTRSMA